MRLWIPALAILALSLPAADALAARSCSSFAVIKSYDAASDTIEVEWERGNEMRFFPKPEGTPRGPSKIPENCRRRVIKDNKVEVKSTGGRLSITQIRTNLDGNMMNDADDESWLPNKLKELIENETEVVLVVRPNDDESLDARSIYLPITDAELEEIERREAQAEDVD